MLNARAFAKFQFNLERGTSSRLFARFFFFFKMCYFILRFASLFGTGSRSTGTLNVRSKIHVDVNLSFLFRRLTSVKNCNPTFFGNSGVQLSLSAPFCTSLAQRRCKFISIQSRNRNYSNQIVDLPSFLLF